MTAVPIQRRHGTGAPLRAGIPKVLRPALDPYRRMLFLLTIITISRVHQHWPVLSHLRPALVMTALIAAYAFLNPKSLNSDSMLQTWPAKLVAIIGIYACISAPFGISLGSSGKFILDTYSKTLLYCFLLIVSVRSSRDLLTLVWSYVISTLILACLSLFFFKLSTYNGYQRLSDLYTYDANDIGCILMIGLALTILTLQVASKRGKIVSAATVLFIGAAMARSGSRGGFLGLVAVGGMLLFMLNRVSIVKRLAFMFVVGLGLVIWAPEGYWTQMSTIFRPTQDYNWSSKDGRREVAKRGIGYMLSYPVFGLGINNFQKAECEMSVKAQEHVAGTGLRCTPPHNSFVQAGAELGLPGLAMWICLTVGGVLAMFRLRRRLPRAWLNGDPEERFLYLATGYFAVAMVGFSVTSFFVSFAWMDAAYFIAALMSGLYICVDKRLGRNAGVAGAAPAAALPALPQSRRRGAPVRTNFVTPPNT
jgi:O-antigen ligase